MCLAWFHVVYFTFFLLYFLTQGLRFSFTWKCSTFRTFMFTFRFWPLNFFTFCVKSNKRKLCLTCNYVRFLCLLWRQRISQRLFFYVFPLVLLISPRVSIEWVKRQGPGPQLNFGCFCGVACAGEGVGNIPNLGVITVILSGNLQYLLCSVFFYSLSIQCTA